MPEPVTMTAILGGAAINIVCGLATNCMEPQRKALWDRVGNWWTKDKTQENHDVLKATHAAYVAAMAKMASAATAIAFTDEERDAASALTALVANPTFAAFRWDGEHLPLDACQERIETLFAGRHMPGSEDDGWRTYNRLIVTDLAAWGVDLPPALAALFIDGHEPHAPWYLAFRHAFAEQLKADEKNPEGERAFRILTFERLNELTANGAVLVEGVEELHRLLVAVDSKVNRILADLGLLSDDVRALLDSVPDLALRREIVALVNSHPLANATEIAGDVARFARSYRALEAQVAAIATTDNHVASLKAAATAALERGVLAEAQRLFGEAKSVRRERAKRETTEAAEFAKAEGDAAILQRDWQAADAAWSEAEALLAPFDWDAAESQCWDAAAALDAHGSRFASLSAMATATSRWRRLRDKAAQRGVNGTTASLANNLGNALLAWGRHSGRDVGPALMAESVDMFHAALKLRTRDAAPAQWAMTQNNLGNALQALGESSGGETGLTLMGQAVNAYRSALEVRTRDTARAEWAMTQNNLGNALQVQGERSVGEAGLALLAQAVDAYRAALEVRTRDAAPAQWALTQNNLGSALQVQGERSVGETGLTLLGQAVVAYRSALEVRTRDAAPAQWAMTQNNLGNALSRQAERSVGEVGLALLAQAVTAYRAALEVRTRDAAPAQWAMTQNNLGTALQVQGERGEGLAGLALLAQAVDAYRAALDVYACDAAPPQWAMAQGNIALALLSLSRATDGMTAREYGVAAREACEAALSVYSPEHMPFYHETATRLLAAIDIRLAELGDQSD